LDQPPTQVVELACNLDDASGEIVGAAVEALLAEGALDAWITPIQMKKGRPGVMVGVLAAPDDADRLARRVIELTGTFGVRRRAWDRLVLEREYVQLDTPFGPIRIKVGRWDGRILAVKCEYDDVRAAADRHRRPVRVVMDAARSAAEQWRRQQAPSDSGAWSGGDQG